MEWPQSKSSSFFHFFTFGIEERETRLALGLGFDVLGSDWTFELGLGLGTK